MSTGTSRKPSRTWPSSATTSLDDALEMGDQRLIARHEEVADGIFAGLRQGDALQSHLLAEETVGNLHENAGAIAHQRIGADGAAMRQVFQDEQAIACTIWCDFWPFICATKPTPQASCSLRGS